MIHNTKGFKQDTKPTTNGKNIYLTEGFDINVCLSIQTTVLQTNFKNRHKSIVQYCHVNYKLYRAEVPGCTNSVICCTNLCFKFKINQRI